MVDLIGIFSQVFRRLEEVYEHWGIRKCELCKSYNDETCFNCHLAPNRYRIMSSKLTISTIYFSLYPLRFHNNSFVHPAIK